MIIRICPNSARKAHVVRVSQKPPKGTIANRQGWRTKAGAVAAELDEATPATPVQTTITPKG